MVFSLTTTSLQPPVSWSMGRPFDPLRQSIGVGYLSMGMVPPPMHQGDSGGTHIPGELGDCIGLRSYHSSCIPRCRENCESAIKERARPLPQCFTPTRFCAGWQQKERISCFTRVEIAADVLGGVSQKNIHKLCGNHTCMNVLMAGRWCHFGSQPQKHHTLC